MLINSLDKLLDMNFGKFAAKRQNNVLAGIGGGLFITLVILPAYFNYIVEDTKRNLYVTNAKVEKVDFKQLVYEKRLEYRRLLAEDKKK